MQSPGLGQLLRDVHDVRPLRNATSPLGQLRRAGQQKRREASVAVHMLALYTMHLLTHGIDPSPHSTHHHVALATTYHPSPKTPIATYHPSPQAPIATLHPSPHSTYHHIAPMTMHMLMIHTHHTLTTAHLPNKTIGKYSKYLYKLETNFGEINQHIF